MINPTHNHHENSLTLIPAISIAITSVVCWIQLAIDERKAKNKTTNTPTTYGTKKNQD